MTKRPGPGVRSLKAFHQGLILGLFCLILGLLCGFLRLLIKELSSDQFRWPVLASQTRPRCTRACLASRGWCALPAPAAQPRPVTRAVASGHPQTTHSGPPPPVPLPGAGQGRARGTRTVSYCTATAQCACGARGADGLGIMCLSWRRASGSFAICLHACHIGMQVRRIEGVEGLGGLRG